MGNADIDMKQASTWSVGLGLKMLDLQQIRQIDGMLASIGEYGEVHLVVQHGELRYINRLESHKAWKSGSIIKTEH